MSVELPEEQQAARRITDSFQNVALARARTTAAAYASETVWHYTSTQNFLSYLNLSDGIQTHSDWRSWEHRKKRSLWATSSRFMNDAREFEQGRDTLQEAVLTYQTRTGLMREKREFLGDLLECILSADGLDVYCICFSTLGDHLGQWRGYGDGGKGVSVGFDREILERSFSVRGQWVVYDSTAQCLLAESLVDSAVGLLADHSQGDLRWKDLRPMLRRQFEEILPSIFLLFKNASFSDEREYRIIYSDGFSRLGVREPRCFRCRGSKLVPFVRLVPIPGDADPFTSICLGPGSQDDANLASLDLLLHELGASGISVETSSIPFLAS